ncbi:hypothetical protein EYF80_062874 [Liparis tanakae]|uniref:Uncharacterized protein n=1 Tax=Liparis tanakae TaxID=230148 RepID=A0A4Z2EE31_9TELE|nr:hypothetical protein EYF80_062874 [Liparis tanakae]
MPSTANATWLVGGDSGLNSTDGRTGPGSGSGSSLHLIIAMLASL